MKACSCLLLLSVFLSVVRVHGQAGGLAAQESKLIALENAWNQAQLHHDSKALETLVGDRFVYTDYDGDEGQISGRH